ncbi:MAG: asparagine synthase-related protein, partial [Bacteroidaceae bacterium]|nr:asparagine synthase-related protein [Bacteroidaceae bacterium]
MKDKDFCLSSYIAFRYIWKDDMDFYTGFHHRNYQPVADADKIPVVTSADIDREIRKQVDALYEKHEHIGILLSGGMDSANLASYLRPGSHAYTFVSKSGVFDDDLRRAEVYCKKWGLVHHLVEITFDDYNHYTPIVMASKAAPVHSIEPQIYKAA